MFGLSTFKAPSLISAWTGNRKARGQLPLALGSVQSQSNSAKAGGVRLDLEGWDLRNSKGFIPSTLSPRLLGLCLEGYIENVFSFPEIKGKSLQVLGLEMDRGRALSSAQV